MSKVKIMSFKADEVFEERLLKLCQRTGKSKAAVLRRCTTLGAKMWIDELEKEKVSLTEKEDTASH